jgi:hypothetical protein
MAIERALAKLEVRPFHKKTARAGLFQADPMGSINRRVYALTLYFITR